MSRTSTLILLGILTILAPFSGLPVSIRSFLTVVFGACVSIIGLMLRAHEVKNTQPPVEMPVPDSEPLPPAISPI